MLSGGTSLQATYCNVGGSQCYGVITTDSHQLATHWTRASGTILGLGSSSTANFVSHATEITKVQVSPATSGTVITDYSTQEKNNLTYGTSSSSCSGGICTMTVTSSN